MRIIYIAIALLMFYLPLPGQELPWQVNPSAFAYQATATIEIRIDYENENSPKGILGVFKGDEIRGVATAVTVGANNIYFLNLYSNSPKDTVQFRFVVEESGKILSRDSLFSFEQAMIYGTVDEPLRVDFIEFFNYAPVWKDIPELLLSQGQTTYQMDLTPWVSDYENEQFRISVATQGAIQASVDDDYLLDLVIPETFTGTQKFVFSAFTTNQTNPPGMTEWYVHVQAEDIAPVALFNSLPVDLFEGDKAYSVSLASLFSSDDNQEMSYSIILPESEEKTNPNWSVSPENFEYNMNITLKASVLGIESNDDTLIIAAFNGEEIRGLSSAVRVNDSLRYFLVAYSNETTESLQFKAWSKSSSKLYNTTFTTPFNPLQSLGTVDNPLHITFGQFSAEIKHNQLFIASDFTFSGSDTVVVKATEMGRTPALFAILSVPVTVHAISKPRFKTFSGETVYDEEPFAQFDLDTLIINSDQSSVDFNISLLESDEGYSYEVTDEHVVSINAGASFGKIVLQVLVNRSDNEAIGDSVRLQFERKASYLPPSEVNLLAPEMDETVPNGSVRFIWSASQGGTLTPEYILRIQPKGGLVNSIRGIRDTSYVLDSVESLPDSAAYTWWVTTTDGRTNVESVGKNQFGINVLVSNETAFKPVKTGILQTFPNPFNPSTQLQFELASTQKISISVFDMSGRKIQTIFSGLKTSGQHQLLINGSQWSSGIYIIQLNTMDSVYTRKIVLIK